MNNKKWFSVMVRVEVEAENGHEAEEIIRRMFDNQWGFSEAFIQDEQTAEVVEEAGPQAPDQAVPTFHGFCEIQECGIALDEHYACPVHGVM